MAQAQLKDAGITAAAASRDGMPTQQAENRFIERCWLWLGLLAAALLALPAVLPLAQPGLPLTHDALFHIGRLVELHQTMATGDLFPRWVQPFAEGLGFPFFNFYAPLSYNLALSLTLLGLTEVDAFKAASALAMLLAAAAMYRWMAEVLTRCGAKGRLRHIPALGAAVAYAYTPYQLVDIYLRGALAESLALALLPLLFCAVDRLRRQLSLNSALLTALILGALTLTHNALSLLGVGLATSYMVFLAVIDYAFSPRPASRLATTRQSLLYFALAAGFGLGLSCFFWAPVVLERSYLSFEQLTTGFFDPAARLIDSWPPVQSSLLFDFQRPFSAGLLQLLLLVPGLAPLVAAARRIVLKPETERSAVLPAPEAYDGGMPPSGTAESGRRSSASKKDRDLRAVVSRELVELSAFFALSVVLVIFLLSPFSARVWGSVPLLHDVQFPFRTLGLLAFGGSTLAGVGFFWLGSRWPRAFLPFTVVVSAGLAATSFAATPMNMTPAPSIDASVIQQVPAFIGWAMRSPEPARDLTPGEAGALARLKAIEQRPGRLSLELEASQATTIALHVLYFPGWKVYVDGQETPAFPLTSRGLLGFSLPGGNHMVLASFERTPLRAGTEAISILSALGMAALVGVSAARRRPATAAALAVVALASLFILPRLAASHAPASEFRSVALLPSGGVRLLGVSLEQPRKGRLGLTLYWQALKPLAELESFVALVDEQGNVVGNPARRPLDWAYQTPKWQIGEIVPDRVELEQPSGFGAGHLRLAAGFRPPGPAESAAPIAAFRVPLSGGSLGALEPPLLELGGFLGLEDHGPSSPVTSPGADLRVDLHWRALNAIPGNIGVYLHLVDAKGKMWAQADWPAGPTSYPAVLWAAGERVREERRLEIPVEAPPGRYSLRFGGYRYPDLQSLPISTVGEAARDTNGVLGAVFVVSPETRPNAVHPRQPLRVNFDNQIELMGFDLTDRELRAGQDLVLTTYWRSLRPVPVDYTLFAQLIDPATEVRGQMDGQIAGDSYPTSLWRTGEFVVDRRRIKVDGVLPGGIYRLVVGFYHWPDMARVPAIVEGAAVGDSVELGSLQAVAP